MSLSSLFKPGAQNVLEKINIKDWKSPEEKKQALDELSASRSVKTADAVRLLFNSDPEVRKAAGKLVALRRDPETIRHFLAALAGRPEAARRAALAEIGQLNVGNVPQQVGALMTDPDPATRKLAAEAVLELPLGTDTVPLLTRVIDSGEAPLRLKAVTRLATAASERQLGYFERLAEDPDERIRFAAYQTIVRFATPAQLPLLMRKVPDEPYATQQLLVAGIQTLLPAAGPEALEPVLGFLVSGSTGLRTAALKILLSLPDRTGTVRRFIAYSRQLAGWVRERALASMREFGEEVLGPALELLADPDPEVRSSALALVASFESKRAVPHLVPLLKDADWWIAINAADVLGRLRAEEALGALVEALGREEVRWSAAEALGHIGGTAAFDALIPLLGDPRPEIRVEALSALVLAKDERTAAILKQVAETDPAKWIRSRATELLGAAAAEVVASPGAVPLALPSGSLPVHALLALARRSEASDLHVSVDSPPLLRVHGTLARMADEALTAAQVEALLMPLLTKEQTRRLDDEKQLDACFFVENDGRYRGNLFVDRKGLNGVFRVIPERPPTVYDLGLPAEMEQIALYHQGIIVVTGPSGCGKSTTLAALVNLLNETRRAHVLTLEDPVEFVHPFKNCLINQRDVGKHTGSFAKALRAALREDPDVIVIGELRDAETVALALTAAETGHVVLTTLNATTAAKAVDRIIGSFPADEQPQVRESFAGSMKLVVAQALIPNASGQGRVGCFEVLKGTPAVVHLIRDNKTYQLPSAMQIGHNVGMRRFDDALLELVVAGKVSPETAYLRATSKESFEPLVSPKFLEEVLA